MKSTKISTILVLVSLVFFFCAGFSKASPLGTSFTYQGHLYDANYTANGQYDFRFKLYDDRNTGIQQGDTIDINDLDVVDGYFTVELDFGSDVFDGDDRWLEIDIRQGDLNDPCEYTTLLPRQKVTPTPYAVYAGNSNYAQTAGSITGGISGSGTTNQIAKFTGPNTIGNSVIYEQNGNVGIGTENLDAKLRVDSDIAYGATAIRVVNTNPANNNGFAFETIQNGQRRIVIAPDWMAFFDVDGTESVGFTSYGVISAYFKNRVGIGTTSPPNSSLEVAGTVHSTSGGFMFPDGTIQTTAAATGWRHVGTQVFNSTASTSYTDLDLSSYVGSNRALVMLKVVNNEGMTFVSFKTKGDPDIGHPTEATTMGGGSSSVQLSPNNCGYVILETDASGVVQWRANDIRNMTINIIGYIK